MSTSEKVRNRLFVVGSPRSGTSLLQSLIGGHPDTYAFPETHLFYNLFHNKLLNYLGITPFKSIADFNSFIKLINIETLDSHYSRWNIGTHKMFITTALDILDGITIANKKHVWAEKTPLHLHCIKQLESNTSNLKFLHIIRKGKDVVKSSYFLSQEHKGTSWENHPTLDYWINRWITDIKITSQYISKNNHLVISYEDLINKPEKTLHKVFNFIELKETSLESIDYRTSAENAKFIDKPWHINLNKDIGPNKLSSYILTREEEEIIERDVPIELYNRLLRKIVTA